MSLVVTSRQTVAELFDSKPASPVVCTFMKSITFGSLQEVTSDVISGANVGCLCKIWLLNHSYQIILEISVPLTLFQRTTDYGTCDNMPKKC